jgi:hypothetical protein
VARVSCGDKTVARPLPENPNCFFISLPVSVEIESEAVSRPEVRCCPLAGVRRSPEGEHAAVEPAHDGALRWRPEPTRRRTDKRRRTRGGPGPFLERVVFDDGRSGHGGEVGPSYH